MTEFSEGLAERTQALRAVFSVRAFRLFSIANVSSLTAIWIIRTAAAWLTWEMTYSKSWLGLVAFAELGPSVLISGFAGVLADRHDRLRILLFGQRLQTMLALLLAVLVLAKMLTVWWLLAILSAYSLVAGLMLPARLAAGPSLAGREHIATASAVVSISLNLTRFIGPLIAAPLLVLGLEALAFAVASVGFAANAYCLSQISRDESAAASVRIGTDGAESVRYGTVLRDMLSSPTMRVVLGLQLLTSLLVRPVIDMFPAFADQVFGRAEGGFGLLSGAVGCGAIVGAAYLVGKPAGRGMYRQIIGGSFLFVAMALLFAYCTNFWAALAVLAVFGLAMTTSGVASTTYVQAHTPMNRLGRVMSVYSVIARLAPAAGALALGTSADWAGLTPAVTVFALLALAVVAIAARSLARV